MKEVIDKVKELGIVGLCRVLWIILWIMVKCVYFVLNIVRFELELYFFIC